MQVAQMTFVEGAVVAVVAHQQCVCVCVCVCGLSLTQCKLKGLDRVEGV